MAERKKVRKTSRKQAVPAAKAMRDEERMELSDAEDAIASLDEAEGRETPVLACPVCGSIRLSWVGGGENAVFDGLGATSISGVVTCSNCLQTVLPIEFSSEEEREEYAANHTPSRYVLDLVKNISLAHGLAYGALPFWLMLSAVGLLAVYAAGRDFPVLILAGIVASIGIYFMAPRK